MKMNAGLLMDDQEDDDMSNATITCRDRAISSMDLRDIDDLVAETIEWDVWDDLKERASFAPRKGRIAQLIRGNHGATPRGTVGL